jgi:hypothetical protein
MPKLVRTPNKFFLFFRALPTHNFPLCINISNLMFIQQGFHSRSLTTLLEVAKLRSLADSADVVNALAHFGKFLKFGRVGSL